MLGAVAAEKSQVVHTGDELEALYVGSLARAIDGDVDNGTMMAGQSAALVHERKTAACVVAELVAEAEALGARDLGALANINARRERAGVVSAAQ